MITGAPRAFDEMLGAGHEVFVCTSPLSGTRWCMPEKLAWVEKHLASRPTRAAPTMAIGPIPQLR